MNQFFLSKEGNLFDFDLTFAFIILEFLTLSFVLNNFLFKPILSTIDNRKSYINKLSNEINLLVKKSENLLLFYENILTKEKNNLSNDNLYFNQVCDSKFEKFLNEVSDWNISKIKKSKTIVFYQLSIMFEAVEKTLKNTENTIYKYLVK